MKNLKSKLIKFAVFITAIVSLLFSGVIVSAQSSGPGVLTPSQWVVQNGEAYLNIGQGTGIGTINVTGCNGCGGGGGGVETLNGLTGAVNLDAGEGMNIIEDGQNIIFSAVSASDVAVTVRAATTAALAGTWTYNNGTAGVGATLTRTTNGVLPNQDGVSLMDGDRFLIKNQASTLVNGVYVLTQKGVASVSPTIFTRATDADTTAQLDELVVTVSEGSTLRGTVWGQQTNNPVVGTSAITFATVPSTSVTQATSGTQVLGQIPYWNTTARQLSKGDSSLIKTSTDFLASVNIGTGNDAIVKSSNNLLGLGVKGVQSGVNTANGFNGLLAYDGTVFGQPLNISLTGFFTTASNAGSNTTYAYNTGTDTSISETAVVNSTGANNYRYGIDTTSGFYYKTSGTPNYFPLGIGSTGQVLTTNGSGQMSWTTPSGGGTPAGSDTQIQYNNAGAFGADSGFTRDVATGNTNISATYTGNLFKQQVNSNIEGLGYEGVAMTFSDGSGNTGFRGLYIETARGDKFISDNLTLSDGTIVENKIDIGSTASVTSAYNGTSFLSGTSVIASDYINIYNDVGAGNELGFFVESGTLLLGNRTGGNNTKITIDDVNEHITISNLPAFDDDTAAGTAGLTAGMVYMTTGSGAAPLNAAGILMIKQ